jgi:hypothetical protein
VNWQRTTPYSERAVGTDYHVSAATAADGVRYSAWHGPLLREQERATWRWPDLIGIFATEREARGACREHAAAHAANTARVGNEA